MKKLFGWIVQIAIVLALVYVGYWAYTNYLADRENLKPQADLPDFQLRCEVEADVRQCKCFDRETGERAQVDYKRCQRLARGR